jgi:hypothetical protein
MGKLYRKEGKETELIDLELLILIGVMGNLVANAAYYIHKWDNGTK